MEIPITQFRRQLFALVEQALAGSEVWVAHKGKRLRILPEHPPGDRLSRIVPMEICNPKFTTLADPAQKAEMLALLRKGWEEDWKRL
jgi:antitoxin (DNA-binding transcriptional repressor) of toxin-antitoxin stability system